MAGSSCLDAVSAASLVIEVAPLVAYKEAEASCKGQNMGEREHVHYNLTELAARPSSYGESRSKTASCGLGPIRALLLTLVLGRVAAGRCFPWNLVPRSASGRNSERERWMPCHSRLQVSVLAQGLCEGSICC